MLDVVVRGGEVVDGTATPRRRADIGISGGRIVEIGSVSAGARRTIDAGGLVAAPGFVDVHTHYDAQALWDPYVTPSVQHGFTTAVGGNCGFSIAPLGPGSRDYVQRMLSRVEGMPLEALAAGTDWAWTTTGEYLDRLDGRIGLNLGFLVGHSAIRRSVMGPEAVERTATDGEVDAMRALLREGLRAGGLGFSSSWGLAHQDWEGAPVPSRHADRSELLALAATCGEFDGTSLEFIPGDVVALDDGQKELMALMSSAAGRPLNWNVMRVDASSLEQCRADLEAGTRAGERGGKVVALTMPIPSRARFSFGTGFVLDAFPDWQPVMSLPPDERLEALRDPDVRRRLAAGATRAASGMQELADWGTKVIVETFAPELARYQGQTVADVACAEGKDPFGALLDVACADGLRTTFSYPQRLPSDADWAAAVDVWRDGRAVIGGSDAGAHVDFTAMFDYPVFVLEHAVRESGSLSWEEAVHRLTDVPATLYGLRGRGRLREGAFADVVVFDPEAIASGDLHTRDDLPGGAGRLYSEPTGIAAVLVNGEAVVDGGELTGALPGTLLRSGVDTAGPVL